MSDLGFPGKTWVLVVGFFPSLGGAVQDATLPFLPGEPLAAKSSKEAVSNFKAGPPGPQRRRRQRAQVEVDHPAGQRWRQ